MHRTIRLVMTATVVGLSVGASASAAGPKVPSAATPALASAPEPAITTKGPGGDYLRSVHARLHGHWMQDFVRIVASTHPPTHPLNDQSRQVTLALTIRWDGTIAESGVLVSSGSSEFDRDALDVTKKSAPFPLPPPEVISDDQYAHLEWTFARDHRACAAGARVVRVEDPLDVSVPRLVRINRIGEALRRVGEAPRNSENAALDQFARLYLARSVPDPVLSTAAAVALASAGDRAQIPRLRAALGSRATLEMATRGLQKLGVDLCDAVHDSLTGTSAPARETAFEAVRVAAAAGTNISSCGPILTALVADAHQPAVARVTALDMLVTYLPVVSRPVITQAMLDPDMSVRGAALLHSVRRGAGRPEMYRLAPMLHDKSVEIRGAASAGMVRAAGDLALDQLYLLGRETDPRPAVLVAVELGQLATPATAELLGKLLKKGNPQIQLAAARALAGRKDPAARTELMAVDPAAPSEVLAVAASVTKEFPTHPVEVVAVAPSTDPVVQLLKENHTHEAVAWIVEKLEALPARDAIDVLGVWLARPTTTASSTPTTSGAAAAQPSPQPSAQPATPAPLPSSTGALAL